ncbi:4-phosphoerythronate dehydrogenase [Marinomonas rhizomae]|uniref:Erythronate-4-phosphate dehydrogenase n=1 Tax=Marinomonas rhizomae TaxID=491948 RepID=A0A366JCU4_9GAMM|nr:4-phosphoerythronate dehydrogenase [Marinomonas rhizomae]RBP84792.1 4-phosphoerythronate dehydrogenase [Marinomonas rhizomae]RNF75011.1 4-phosphoerythronate dehydrogenase [Marinomonas rhizomae]
MKIIADENMPNAKALFSHLGDVELVNGRTLTHEQVKDADVLLVRSVTKVTKLLLEGSSVRFVGSATIGVDHVDLECLAELDVAFSSAPGCNAEAVADYVFSSLSHLYMTKKVSWLNKKIGIIGYGNVGKTVYDRFANIGCQVCVYDPIKEKSRDFANFVTLDEILSCDVISLHAPLTHSGLYATSGMIGREELARLSAGVVVISAGRGGVIDERALLERHAQLDGNIHLVLDVWDNEPSINQELVAIADIATPHIAGYSKQGREKGTWMVYQALCHYLRLNLGVVNERDAISAGWISSINANAEALKEEMLARSVQAIYDVARDDARLRYKYRENKEKNVFDWLRKHYVERDELNTCLIRSHDNDASEMMGAIGFSVQINHN